MLARQLKRALNLPFASHNAFVRVQAELPEARMVMTTAQDQHRGAILAIESGDGARAEAIMRDHARLAIRNLEFALRNQRTRKLVPGSVLLTRSRSGRCLKSKLDKERNVQRTKAPFRADQVGSFLRSEPLKDARAKREKGEISAADLKKVEDTEIEKLIKKQEDIGMQLVTDGEYRRSWWHFDFLEQLGGVEGYESDHGIQFAGVQTRARGVKRIRQAALERPPVRRSLQVLESAHQGHAEDDHPGAVGAALPWRPQGHQQDRLSGARRVLRRPRGRPTRAP